jgi:hypothetical protein
MEVLINVQILTEGVDIPEVQTVFLTRPTSSEILLRQMIGRALRGTKAGGTEVAYIVSFEDHWDKFRDWESPLDLVSDITQEAREEEIVDESGRVEILPPPRELSEAVPWDIIQSTARELRLSIASTPVERFEAVPDGWYVLEREVDGIDVRQVIHVLQHQRSSWEAFVKTLATATADARQRMTSERSFAEFFSDCAAPAPALYRIEEMLAHFGSDGEMPEYTSFAERNEVSPIAVARTIIERDLGPNARSAELQRLYAKPLTRAVYPTLREYISAVDEAIYAIQHPMDAAPPKPEPIFDDPNLVPLRAGPFHDLKALFADVIRDGSTLLGQEIDASLITVSWTKRPNKQAFAFAHWGGPKANQISVNVLVDSPDIAADTIRALLWHEYLHIHLKALHTPEFHHLERKWPGIVDADRELDNMAEKFEIKWW